MFVYGINIGTEVLSNEGLDMVIMAFLDKSRKTCLHTPDIALAHLEP
jgi:hypothetical protein